MAEGSEVDGVRIKRRYAFIRKGSAPTKRMNVYVAEDSWSKADQMAGPVSLSAFVDELIQREYRRREKRMEMVLSVDSTCTSNGAVGNSA